VITLHHSTPEASSLSVPVRELRARVLAFQSAVFAYDRGEVPLDSLQTALADVRRVLHQPSASDAGVRS
jgi:hypothetical protein